MNALPTGLAAERMINTNPCAVIFTQYSRAYVSMIAVRRWFALAAVLTLDICADVDTS